jgi:hypothetical protein
VIRGVLGRALLAALLLAGSPGVALCAERPSWVEGTSAEWPQSRYLTGVGSGDERDVAETRARAELARTFVARVESAISSEEQESSRSRSGKTETEHSITARDATQISTSGEIEGTTIAAVWTDPATRRVYALAVLDRQKALAALLVRLGEIDTMVEKVLEIAPAASDRVGVAMTFLKLKEQARLRAPLVAQVRVLSPGTDPGKRVDYAAIMTRTDKALAALRVAIPRGLEAEVEEGIRKGLVAAGFRNLVTSAAGADLEVAVVVEKPEPERIPPWTWVQMQATGRVQEVGGGRVLAEFKCSARQGSLLQTEARKRARRALSQSLEETIAGSLTGDPATPNEASR